VPADLTRPVTNSLQPGCPKHGTHAAAKFDKAGQMFDRPLANLSPKAGRGAHSRSCGGEYPDTTKSRHAWNQAIGCIWVRCTPPRVIELGPSAVAQAQAAQSRDRLLVAGDAQGALALLL